MFDNEVWDVVVVGGGPTGSSAGAAAAKGGSRVLIVDKATFPRYKTCGGGLIGPSMKHLPERALKTVELRPNVVEFSRSGKTSGTVRDGTPFLGMVQRAAFDESLVAEAVAQGAIFRDQTRVTAIREVEDRVVLSTSGGDVHSKIVIGADGAGGRLGRYVGVEMARVDLGLEHEYDATNHEGWPDKRRVYLDWGKERGSYAWLFPKANLVTVGVIQERGQSGATRAYLEDWLRYLRLNDAEPIRSSGHLTQWRTSRSPLQRGRVILAGETAGLLEPWTREGISFALRSGGRAGTAAAEAAAAGAGFEVALAEYVLSIEKDLIPEIEAGAQLLSIFERRAGIIDAALGRFDRLGRFFIDYCRGDKSFAESVPRPLLRLLSRLLGS